MGVRAALTITMGSDMVFLVSDRDKAIDVYVNVNCDRRRVESKKPLPAYRLAGFHVQWLFMPRVGRLQQSPAGVRGMPAQDQRLA
jgi:hypothetical protein